MCLESILTTWYCVLLLEEFIKLSDGLVVIVTWTYFERLWCVYTPPCCPSLHVC